MIMNSKMKSGYFFDRMFQKYPRDSQKDKFQKINHELHSIRFQEITRGRINKEL